jgi:hypothetical protein
MSRGLIPNFEAKVEGIDIIEQILKDGPVAAEAVSA